jgi:hypothetical protein
MMMIMMMMMMMMMAMMTMIMMTAYLNLGNQQFIFIRHATSAATSTV